MLVLADDAFPLIPDALTVFRGDDAHIGDILVLHDAFCFVARQFRAPFRHEFHGPLGIGFAPVGHALYMRQENGCAPGLLGQREFLRLLGRNVFDQAHVGRIVRRRTGKSCGKQTHPHGGAIRTQEAFFDRVR